MFPISMNKTGQLGEASFINSLAVNGFTLSKHQFDEIERFVTILREWNDIINLTAHKSVEDIIEKDVIDCLYLNMYVIKYVQKLKSCIDMGAGAGSCGIILKIMNPEVRIGFLDSDRKKINFIKEISRKLHLESVVCLHGRVEDLGPEQREKWQLSVSRATWNIIDYLRLTYDYVQNNGHVFFMAGTRDENPVPDTEDYQGLQRRGEIFYRIQPKNYDRKIIYYLKK